LRNIASTKPNLVIKTPHEVTAILIGAAPGRHSASYGPKSLFDICGKTLLRRQVEELHKAGIHDIVGVFGFESESLVKPCRDLKVKFVENYYWDYRESGMVRSVDYGLKLAVSPKVLIIHADILFEAHSILDLHNSTCVLIDDTKSISKNKPGAVLVDGVITNFFYGLPNKWCQITMLTGPELDKARDLCHAEKNWQLTTFEMLNLLIDKQGRIEYAMNYYPIKEIESHQDSVNASKYFMSK